MKLSKARAIDRSFLLVGTLGLAGKAYAVPSASFWDDVTARHPVVVLVLLATVGVFGALAPVEAITARARANRALNVRKHILTRFGQIIDIARDVAPPLPINDLALHIWRIRRTFRHPWGGVLARVATYRLGTTPTNRPFSPPKGVGVVGLCWKRDEEVEVDVAALAESLKTQQEYDEYARTNGGDAVMNLSWPEFSRIKHRGAIFAMPIRNGRSKFIGCVSVDASRGYPQLAGQQLLGEMGTVCITVAEAGFESC
ncbi:hypothetical protein LWC34_38125 [Kibdelosporangium philippinense]|uniref:GAF domain-containing protein n=1 Tax=Kibdelosporangium philippinense TaxID=211113 RepID=A0ABS8ZNR7_9PSEU|nr:hypothetical protein [Kibdelosporangium philippinense]MCE7008590.1 hypothetical protein [Kibdelosporangium philippinense]